MKQKLNQFLTGLAITVAIAATSVIGLEILRIYQFEKGSWDYLPADSTIAVVQISADKTNTQFRNIRDNINEEDLKDFANLEENFLTESFINELQINKSKEKVIALVENNNTFSVLLIFESNLESNNQISEKDNYFYYTTKDRLLVSNDKSLLEKLQKNFTPLSSDPKFLDAEKNITRNDIAYAYINYDLLTENFDLPQENLISLLGVTYSSLKASPDGLYLTTYTNPRNEREVEFPSISQKYEAKLLNEIPANPKLVIGGQNLTDRFNKTIQNFNYNFAVNSYIKNQLIKYNLNEQSFNFISEIFKNEYALALYNENQIVLAFEAKSREQKQNFLNELNKIAAYFDPEVVTFELEDGQTGKKLVPNSEDKAVQAEDSIYSFELTDLNETIYIKLEKDAVLISQSQELFNTEKKFDSSKVNKVMTISDEIIYTNAFQIPQFEIEIPETISAFNYFRDGIQTVHFIPWPTN